MVVRRGASSRAPSRTKNNRLPKIVNIDKSGANNAGIKDYNRKQGTKVVIRQCKYLNNIVEQDHRAVKRIARPIQGFEEFRCARIILGGVELMHMIRKGQMRDDGRGYPQHNGRGYPQHNNSTCWGRNTDRIAHQALCSLGFTRAPLNATETTMLTLTTPRRDLRRFSKFRAWSVVTHLRWSARQSWRRSWF
jgi:hypothetical protein